MTTPADLPELPPLTDAEDGFGWHALNYRTAHTVHAQAMYEELKAFVERYGQACYAAGVRAGMEMAAVIAEGEKLGDPNTESDGDIAYDMAIDHCVAAIRAAKEKSPSSPRRPEGEEPGEET